MAVYDKNFYKAQMKGSITSARQIVPIVVELFEPKSVVDIGCGIGTWLSVFAENGVHDFLGVDGEWVDFDLLQIPRDRFAIWELTKPLKLDRRFDLVVSLEVAEHIDGKYAEVFVDSLTRLGPVILFSAAIPQQGGTHHVNERWPDYWTNLFNNRGYAVIDAIRKRVWQKDDVEWWYAQNVLIFADEMFLEGNPRLKDERENTNISQLSLVHPKLYLIRSAPRDLSFMELVKALPTSFRKAMARRIKRLPAKSKTG